MKVLALLLILLPGMAWAEGFVMPTLGGRQVWSDIEAHAGWRIQENLLTGHFRLLDPDNGRHAWGSLDACRQKLADKKQQSALSWSSDHLVILIHGLGRGHHIWTELQPHLAALGYDSLAISYASTRGTTQDHAARLAKLIAGLQDVSTISFVTHSFGGLILRQTLALPEMQPHLTNINAAILLGPPNNGAVLADRLQDMALYEWIGGEGGQSVTTMATASLPTLSIPYGIIAGGKGDDAGFNPLIPGDDDGIVAVEEARLPGTDHFLVIPELHTFLMDHRQAVSNIQHFLRHHRFQH